MVSMKSFWIERALVERRFVDLVVQLDVELHAAHAREIVLARVEEHALEELRGGVERGRIAGTQLAVDFEQRVVLRSSPGPCAGWREMTLPASSRSGKKTSKSSECRLRCSLSISGGGQLVVGFHQHFAGGHVDHIGGDVGAFADR